MLHATKQRILNSDCDRVWTVYSVYEDGEMQRDGGLEAARLDYRRWSGRERHKPMVREGE